MIGIQPDGAICSDEQVQDLLGIGNPTEDEYRLIRLGWDAAYKLAKQLAQAGEPEGMAEFLTDLRRSRTKYPKNRRMFDALLGELDELRRAYVGDGDIRAEAFDVAVCAFRIATEGDAGGNTALKPVANTGIDFRGLEHRIATVAAEELIRSEGESTGAPDTFSIPQCQVDDHMRDCIAHLVWHGEAACYETEDGHIIVLLLDFTLGGGL